MAKVPSYELFIAQLERKHQVDAPAHESYADVFNQTSRLVEHLKRSVNNPLPHERLSEVRVAARTAQESCFIERIGNAVDILEWQPCFPEAVGNAATTTPKPGSTARAGGTATTHHVLPGAQNAEIGASPALAFTRASSDRRQSTTSPTTCHAVANVGGRNTLPAPDPPQLPFHKPSPHPLHPHPHPASAGPQHSRPAAAERAPPSPSAPKERPYSSSPQPRLGWDRQQHSFTSRCISPAPPSGHPVPTTAADPAASAAVVFRLSAGAGTALRPRSLTQDGHIHQQQQQHPVQHPAQHPQQHPQQQHPQQRFQHHVGWGPILAAPSPLAARAGSGPSSWIGEAGSGSSPGGAGRRMPGGAASAGAAAATAAAAAAAPRGGRESPSGCPPHRHAPLAVEVEVDVEAEGRREGASEPPSPGGGLGLSRADEEIRSFARTAYEPGEVRHSLLLQPPPEGTEAAAEPGWPHPPPPGHTHTASGQEVEQQPDHEAPLPLAPLPRAVPRHVSEALSALTAAAPGAASRLACSSGAHGPTAAEGASGRHSPGRWHVPSDMGAIHAPWYGAGSFSNQPAQLARAPSFDARPASPSCHHKWPSISRSSGGGRMPAADGTARAAVAAASKELPAGGRRSPSGSVSSCGPASPPLTPGGGASAERFHMTSAPPPLQLPQAIRWGSMAARTGAGAEPWYPDSHSRISAVSTGGGGPAGLLEERSSGSVGGLYGSGGVQRSGSFSSQLPSPGARGSRTVQLLATAAATGVVGGGGGAGSSVGGAAPSDGGGGGGLIRGYASGGPLDHRLLDAVPRLGLEAARVRPPAAGATAAHGGSAAPAADPYAEVKRSMHAMPAGMAGVRNFIRPATARPSGGDVTGTGSGYSGGGGSTAGVWDGSMGRYARARRSSCTGAEPVTIGAGMAGSSGGSTAGGGDGAGGGGGGRISTTSGGGGGGGMLVTRAQVDSYAVSQTAAAAAAAARLSGGGAGGAGAGSDGGTVVVNVIGVRSSFDGDVEPKSPRMLRREVVGA